MTNLEKNTDKMTSELQYWKDTLISLREGCIQINEEMNELSKDLNCINIERDKLVNKNIESEEGIRAINDQIHQAQLDQDRYEGNSNLLVILIIAYSRVLV